MYFQTQIASVLARVRQSAAPIVSMSRAVHLLLLLIPFVLFRVWLSLRAGIILDGDGAAQVGELLGRYWTGEATWEQITGTGGVVNLFLADRGTQLLYPLLISLQGPIGWSLETHILVLNTFLGATMVTGSYYVGLRLSGKTYAVLVTLLSCSLTPLYGISRWAVVDNLFYAMLPLVLLTLINWLKHRTSTHLLLMTGTFVLLLSTRPESAIVLLMVLAVVTWNFLCNRFSLRTAIASVTVVVVLTTIGGLVILNSSSNSTLDCRLGQTRSLGPRCTHPIFSRAHLAWGLSASSQTLLNVGGTELDRLLYHYDDLLRAEQLGREEVTWVMSLDAIDVISQNPLQHFAKMPLRALAFLFPWTYQPWSLRHVGYEAVYTLFLVGGMLLLLRHGWKRLIVRATLAIPLSILLFLSAYGIDNDLKHRNGIFVALHLIAPLGYFLPSRDTDIDHG